MMHPLCCIRGLSAYTNKRKTDKRKVVFYICEEEGVTPIDYNRVALPCTLPPVWLVST